MHTTKKESLPGDPKYRMSELLNDYFAKFSASSIEETFWDLFSHTISSPSFDGIPAHERANMLFQIKETIDFIKSLPLADIDFTNKNSAL